MDKDSSYFYVRISKYMELINNEGRLFEEYQAENDQTENDQAENDQTENNQTENNYELELIKLVVEYGNINKNKWNTTDIEIISVLFTILMLSVIDNYSLSITRYITKYTKKIKVLDINNTYNYENYNSINKKINRIFITSPIIILYRLSCLYYKRNLTRHNLYHIILYDNKISNILIRAFNLNPCFRLWLLYNTDIYIQKTAFKYIEPI